MHPAFNTPSYHDDRFSSHGYEFLKQISSPYQAALHSTTVFAVMHCYDGSLPYIYALSNMVKRLVIIPKQSTIKRNQHVLEHLKSLPNCDIASHLVNKLSLQHSEFTQTFIDKHCDGPFLILDHGGYFANASQHFQAQFKQRCHGIAELTANGYYKYQQSNVTTPVVSVSHLSIKKPADYEAAECIVHYCDHVIREQFGAKLNNAGFFNIGIIGAGNLGLGLIKYLQGKGIADLSVADYDPRKLTMLTREGLKVRSIKQLVNDCNLLFCATGNGAIPPSLYQDLQPDTIIATVTSADDELHLPQLEREKVIVKDGETDWLTQFQTQNGRTFYLLAGGDSVNTLFKTGMGDPTVYLFEAAHMLAGIQLAYEPERYSVGLHHIDELSERFIAAEWLSHFYDYK